MPTSVISSVRPLPLWRSMLFVPVLNERFVAGAARRGADVIVLDLEDSIPSARKEEARAVVATAAAAVGADGADVVVRINRPWRLAVRDTEAAVGRAVTALALPKVPDAGHVRALGEILAELEVERGLPCGHTGLVAMIETAEGLADMPAIARASDRVLALAVGPEDLAASMGMRSVEEALFGPGVEAVAAARAAGRLPIAFVGTMGAPDDADTCREAAERARDAGFAGGMCIHPKQVPALNAAFSPTAAEVEEARALVAAYQTALADGRGAILFRGGLVDRPVAERAQKLLRLAERTAARDGA